jgi:putative transcriptional regulator
MTADDKGYLTGNLLIAMPAMGDPRFARTVIYMCVHNEDGAMGLVINRLIESLNFSDLLAQLGIDSGDAAQATRVHFGGPVETGRGFVLHSADYLQESSLKINNDFALTATMDVLRDIAGGSGPRRSLLALGYAGWGPGQLDAEIQANGWLHADADEELLFDNALESKWERAITKLGVDLGKLSGAAGHA